MHRRASRMTRSLSRMSRHAGMGYDAMRSTVIKFKRKGGFRSGITLGEAMSDAHLSQNHEYSLYDLNADGRGRIILKIRVRPPSVCSAQSSRDTAANVVWPAVVGVQLDDVRAARGLLRRPRRAPDPCAKDRAGVRALLAGKHASCGRHRSWVPCTSTASLTTPLQANMIPVSWDRVILYHLEEISPGTWQPVLSTS